MDDENPDLEADDTTEGVEAPSADDVAGDETEAPASMRDELFAAIEEAETADETPASDATNIPPKVDATENGPPPGAPETETAGAGEGEDGTPPPGGAEFIPPAHWPAELRETFDGMTDADAKNIVLDLAKRQEAAHTKRSEELAVKRREHEPFQPVIDRLAPYQQSFASNGTDAPAFVGSLIAAHENLLASPAQAIASIATSYRADPSEVIRTIANAAGLDLSELAYANMDTPGTGVPSDQANQAILDRLTAIEGNVTQTNNQNRAAAETQGAAVLTGFIDAKNEQGQPLRPYYAEVEGDILTMAQGMASRGEALTETTLGELYEKAVWANEGTRAKALQDRDRIQTTDRRRMAAEKAGTSVRTTPGAGGTSEKPATLRDELVARLEEAGSA